MGEISEKDQWGKPRNICNNSLGRKFQLKAFKAQNLLTNEDFLENSEKCGQFAMSVKFRNHKFAKMIKTAPRLTIYIFLAQVCPRIIVISLRQPFVFQLFSMCKVAKCFFLLRSFCLLARSFIFLRKLTKPHFGIKTLPLILWFD